jgi:transposase
MIVLQTHLTYQKDLRNLHLQEARIDRKRAKALTELNQLQSLRKQKEEPSQADTASESDSLSEADLFAALDAGYVPSSIAGTLKSQQPVRKDGFVFSDSREQASPSAAEPSDPAVNPRDRAA